MESSDDISNVDTEFSGTITGSSPAKGHDRLTLALSVGSDVGESVSGTGAGVSGFVGFVGGFTGPGGGGGGLVV